MLLRWRKWRLDEKEKRSWIRLKKAYDAKTRAGVGHLEGEKREDS